MTSSSDGEESGTERGTSSAVRLDGRSNIETERQRKSVFREVDDRYMNGLSGKDEEKSLPGLGTWAGRQRIFGPAIRMGNNSHEETTGLSNLIEGSDTNEVDGSSVKNGLMQQRQGDAAEMGSVDYMHEAWRWRFARKWQLEQLQQQEPLQPELSNEFDDDEWNSALEYMNAAAGGLNLQFGRTTSLDRSSSIGPGASMSSVLLASSFSKGDVFPASETPGGSEIPGSLEITPLASRHVARTALKARELMACQEKIEKEVAQRWESASAQEPAWVAQRIPTVTIDSYGSFDFILSQVFEESSGRQKLLVRGRNGLSENQISMSLQREVADEARTLRRPEPKVRILGSGLMTWRDRTLLINGANLKQKQIASSPVQTREDVARVAGALARTGATSVRSVHVHF